MKNFISAKGRTTNKPLIIFNLRRIFQWAINFYFLYSDLGHKSITKGCDSLLNNSLLIAQRFREYIAMKFENTKICTANIMLSIFERETRTVAFIKRNNALVPLFYLISNNVFCQFWLPWLSFVEYADTRTARPPPRPHLCGAGRSAGPGKPGTRSTARSRPGNRGRR